MAHVCTEHGGWWMAWTDRGLIAAAPTRAEVVARAGEAGHRDMVPGDPAAAPSSPDWSALPGGFRGRVLRECARIPRGEVATYGALAAAAGRPGAARAVGTAMARNPLPVVVPCHRVVRADGGVGEYGMGGPRRKERMLRVEGVDVRDGRVARATMRLG